jgi:FtsZ-binding cell division protein ZapB
MSDYENIGDEVENAIVYALEAMRDSKVWRGPLRIDGTVKEFAEDVLSFVRAADDMKEDRNVVSLGTYQAATEERDALREQVVTLTAERERFNDVIRGAIGDKHKTLTGDTLAKAMIGTVTHLRADVERLTKERDALQKDNDVQREISYEVVDHLATVLANYDCFTLSKYHGGQPAHGALCSVVGISYDATKAVIDKHRAIYESTTYCRCYLENAEQANARHLAAIETLRAEHRKAVCAITSARSTLLFCQDEISGNGEGDDLSDYERGENANLVRMIKERRAELTAWCDAYPEWSKERLQRSDGTRDLPADYAKKADEVESLPCKPGCSRSERCVACKVNDGKKAGAR